MLFKLSNLKGFGSYRMTWPQLSIKFFLLINVIRPTTVGILTFMSRKNSILSLSQPEKRLNFLISLYFLAFEIQLS